MHGGKSPNALAGAAKRRTERLARLELEALDHYEPVTDHVAALEDLASQMVELTRILRGYVSALNEVAYAGGMGQGVEQIKGELQAYLQSAAMTEKVLASIIKLDLEGRRVRIREAEALVMVAAVNTVLAGLGLSDDLQKQARVLLARELKQPQAIEAQAVLASR